MGSGTHCSKIDGFPGTQGTHANEATVERNLNSIQSPMGVLCKIICFLGQSSQMYVNVTRSQTEEPKLEYSAYATPQQGPGSQHLTQQTTYLSESDFGSHATPTKEEPALFTISSQQPTQQQSQQQTQQQSQQSTLPGTKAY